MTQKGIWAYEKLLQPYIKQENRFTLGEGNTPLQEIEIDNEKIYIKREDLNPTGSHKDRGVAFQISAHIQDGNTEFALSSSGNAAISAINILKDTKYILHIFLSSKLPVAKTHRLVKSLNENISSEIFKGKDVTYKNIHFHFSKKPLSTAFIFCKENNITSLRGSTDIHGYEGFKTIAYEIPEDIDSIFIPSSSGTTAKGIYEGLKKNNCLVPLHIVQTSKINTLVHRFDQDYQPSIHSKADAIVDRIGHRVKEIEDIIKTTNGAGWIISDTEIDYIHNILLEKGINTSYESALSIAGLKKAKRKGYKIKKPICIFTGTN